MRLILVGLVLGLVAWFSWWCAFMYGAAERDHERSMEKLNTVIEGSDVRKAATVRLATGVYVVTVDDQEYVVVDGPTGTAICPKTKSDQPRYNGKTGD